MNTTRNLILVGLAMFSIASLSAPLAQAAPISVQALAPALDPEDSDEDVPEEPDPPNPLPDIIAAYTRCEPVTVNLGVIKANVSVLNTSCRFGRDFVRKNRFTLCGPESSIRGWQKTFTGSGKNVWLKLSKGSKRIRTDACGA